MCGYRRLPEVARYQSWEDFGMADAGRLIADQQAAEFGNVDSWLQLMIVLTREDTIIGDCGIHFLSNPTNQVELGITLDPRYQHRGFAFESLEAVLSCLFDSQEIHRVSATTDVDNRAAQKLLQRLGFRREAHFVENIWFKRRWGSEYVFAMLWREWQARSNRNRGATS
jgi:RimJ/RimL family protein N-acetyltransferase